MKHPQTHGSNGGVVKPEQACMRYVGDVRDKYGLHASG
eukprot:CAMPEP_0119329878 /NCGR_PEP_ID=MMETSP1333-20130426/76948_1 /TAXON_ID=418940 /ORGANISM="Scyphosphaera apsteinii, Strain RCC1455" /LENGTH=37 /DNA_ID= /DNA_START= /DNA_END= /DNA_ORIENTATION=